MTLKLGEILYEDDLRREEEHKEREREKLGYMRAGNSGVKLSDGNIAGECPRLVLIRRMGLEKEPITRDRHVMFEGGYIHQAAIAEKFRKMGLTVMEEGTSGEVRTSWLCDGVPVTGSIDIGVGKGKLEYVTDCKQVSSLWTARDILIEGHPKFVHLCQLGHYMMETGLPGKLIYASYVDFAVNDWAWKLLPLQGENEYSQYLQYRPRTDKVVVPESHAERVRATGYKISCSPYKSGPRKGMNKLEANIHIPKKILPFREIYDVSYESDQITYKRECDEKWQYAPITSEGIRLFYSYVLQLERERDLGKRPLTLNSQGKPENYNKCDYCPLQEICDECENNYDRWLNEVRKICTSNQ